MLRSVRLALCVCACVSWKQKRPYRSEVRAIVDIMSVGHLRWSVFLYAINKYPSIINTWFKLFICSNKYILVWWFWGDLRNVTTIFFVLTFVLNPLVITVVGFWGHSVILSSRLETLDIQYHWLCVCIYITVWTNTDLKIVLWGHLRFLWRHFD